MITKENIVLSPYEVEFSIAPFLDAFTFPKNPELKEYYQNLFSKIEHVLVKEKEITGIVMDNASLFDEFFSILIPEHISKNEYKAVVLPVKNTILYRSEKLNEIDCSVKESIRFFDASPDTIYKLKAMVILNSIIENKITLDNKIIFEFKDNKGVYKTFFISNKNDFLKIYPKDTSRYPTTEQIDMLLDDLDNIDLWKEIFPEGSWNVEGFCILTMVENTLENAVSQLKTNLLSSQNDTLVNDESFKKIFRSIFDIPDLKIGITVYDSEENALIKTRYNDVEIDSFILNDKMSKTISEFKNDQLLKYSILKREPIYIQNLEQYSISNSDSVLLKVLLEQDIQSVIIAPIVSRKGIIGTIELVSETKYAINKKSLSRLKLILPIITNTLERSLEATANRIDAIIQNEYTSIHPSVYWKFKQGVRDFLNSDKKLEEYSFKDIVFKDVFALFGQIDIKNSSHNRQLATIEDIRNQLQLLVNLFQSIISENKILIADQILFELDKFSVEIENNFDTTSESSFKLYVESEVHPVLETMAFSEGITEKVTAYFEKLDPKLNIIYDNRKAYDESVALLNKKMSSYLDECQLEAQKIFPHYYERYATDGIEHNMYIGASINPRKEFSPLFFNNLRLWQLKSLCETVYNFQKWKHILEFPLEVTTLILAFSSPLTIRFRMDEKLFDVDGSYNARYEVVKKRIDKSHIKNSEERITQENKITIVYAQNSEKVEYMKYLKYLIAKGLLEEEIEKFDVEELQSISGLKALRVTIKSIPNQEC